MTVTPGDSTPITDPVDQILADLTSRYPGIPDETELAPIGQDVQVADHGKAIAQIVAILNQITAN